MFDIQAYIAQIKEAAALIRTRHAEAPRVGIICGTGMGALADKVENKTVIPYKEIPNFPLSTVESHSGNLMLGRLSGKPVMVMQGRFHFYEGYTMKQVTFPVRVMRELGCDTLIVMNAVGSMNPLIPAGSLVLVDDHINFMGDNPLLGPNSEELGVRFPDMSQPYCPHLRALAREVTMDNRIRLHEGVLVAVAGPNLETRAEYRMFQIIGADIVSMSTVPEVIVGNHAGMKVMAISTVTDNCLPDALKPAKLEEIIAVAQAAEPRLEVLVTGVLGKMK
jgi:purine-nucleoside phosphorylase